MEKIIEIPEGYKARIEGNKVVIELKESEDETIRKEIVSALKFANDSGIYDKHIAYLEEHKEPTWTAEDESFVEHILPRILNPDMWTLDQRTADKKYLTEFIERQKRKFTKEQKPAEWSKEDEKCCKIALLALNDHPLNQDELKAFNWLRALKSRFGWKPSEEQMKALSFVKENFKDVPSAFNVTSFLIQLYDDLKKLK